MSQNKLKDYIPLVATAIVYDSITPVSFPVMAPRIAQKELLVKQMSDYIQANVPLEFAYFSYLKGLKAGFARAIGESGTPRMERFGALQYIAQTADATDWNVKWQVVRAFRNLSVRFPNNIDAIAVREAAETTLPLLYNGADAALKAGIVSMMTKIGVT